MTRFIGKFLFFAIALNGIACACPGDLDTSSGSHHEMHVEIDSGANDCHGNGNDEFCHYPEIYQASHAGVAASYNFLQPEDDWDPPAITAMLQGSIWPSGPPTEPAKLIEDPLKKHSSPITLKDRMLD